MVLDKWLCIIQGLIYPIKAREFLSAVIKNKCYWRRHVPFQEIDNYSNTKQFLYVTPLQGKIDHYNDDTFFMNEPDYMIKLMSAYDGIAVKNGKITENNL